MLQSGIGWVMTWIAERPENGTENIVLYDVMKTSQAGQYDTDEHRDIA
jgi:hypothetical protein